jgi:geranylgeranyl diphosphate synthase type I
MEMLELISRADRARCEESLLRALEGLEVPPELRAWRASLRELVLAGGKRIRPQLCLWMWRRAGGEGATLPAAVVDMACAWELFHAFLLIHDDLIDQADTRRDGPSLHRRIEAATGLPATTGRHLALVAGDLLFAAATRMVGELSAPLEVHRLLLRLFGRIAVTTGLGQALDIVWSHAGVDGSSQEDLLRQYQWKTAAYTFEGPMLSGAILAGATEGQCEPVARFAQALGQAYQLQNDLLDLSAPPQIGGDLVQGKRTVTLLRARQSLDGAGRQRLDALLRDLAGSNTDVLTKAREVREQLVAAGALTQTRELIGRLLEDARQAAEEAPPGLGRALAELLVSLEETYFR